MSKSKYHSVPSDDSKLNRFKNVQ